MVTRSITLKMGAMAVALFVGCSEYRQSTEESTASGATQEPSGESWKDVELQAEQAVMSFKQTDPSINRFFDSSVAYAVFPEVAKGAVGIGAANGEGVVYEKVLNKKGEVQKDDKGQPMWEVVGYCELMQGTIGPQLGGQVYREIIFFQNKSSLSEFKNEDAQLSAQASAVAAANGAAKNADYAEGVAVFTKPKSGLMFEASIGGQKFDYYPKAQAEAEEKQEYDD